MKIQLSDHFTYRRLLRFVFPSILMILCTSVYSIVDGFFVSNFAGKTPFAALNLIMPVLMGVGCIGFMLGTGGSAVIARTLGEGKPKLANEYFTMLVFAAFLGGFIISALGFIFTPQIASLLGATGELKRYCVIYARILFCSAPAFVLQYVFQSFFVAAQKPELSLRINISAGIANIILDYLLIVVFDLGLAGAAIATAVGEYIGGLTPVFYFCRKNNSLLQFTKLKFHGKILLQACANGCSEMVTNLSTSLVNILYNFQLMNIAGENGVAAYGIVMYINIVFMAIYLGYSIGSAPIVSYHYGAGNHPELKNMLNKSLRLISITGISLLVLSELLSRPLVLIFANYDADLLAMTVHGFRLYAVAFLIMGFNVWGSSFFTALNNGIVSACISFLRTLVFQAAAILILPVLFGINGIWLSIVAAESPAVLVTFAFLVKNRERYNYGRTKSC